MLRRTVTEPVRARKTGFLELGSFMRLCRFRMDRYRRPLMAEKRWSQWHDRLAGIGLRETPDRVIKSEGADYKMRDTRKRF